MASDQDMPELLKAVRGSESKKGRTYADQGISAEWLAKEIAEYCKTQGWENTIHQAGQQDVWLVISDYVAALVEGTQSKVTFTVTDLNPVRLKTALVSSGLLALTGVGIVGLPIAGAAAWRARHRKKKVEAIVQFVEQRVQTNRTKPEPQATASVAARLKDLESLREQGLITDQEYTDKREQVLKQL
jgi:hypothetical protein